MHQVDQGPNPLTVLVESVTTEETSDFIVVQRKGEAIRNPIVPASRSAKTIIYEIKAEDEMSSIMELLATCEDIPMSVSNTYFQKARSLDREGKNLMIENNTMWVLGQIKVEFSLVSKAQYLIQVVHIDMHQGHKTACVQALLLAPRVADTGETAPADALNASEAASEAGPVDPPPASEAASEAGPVDPPHASEAVSEVGPAMPPNASAAASEAGPIEPPQALEAASEAASQAAPVAPHDASEADNWKTWGFTEVTPMSEIETMSKTSHSFRLVSKMAPTMFSLDVNNTAKSTTFEF